RSADLVPRRRRLRAGRLPLPCLRPGEALPHRCREHRPLGRPAVSDPLARNRRVGRLHDRRRPHLGARAAYVALNVPFMPAAAWPITVQMYLWGPFVRVTLSVADLPGAISGVFLDRKSTRLNSSH